MESNQIKIVKLKVFYYFKIVIITMPKNKVGGNKAKKQGRKHVVVPTARKVRKIENDGEIFACCEKINGGNQCTVTCIDGKKRLCIIRKKFRGRHKTDNRIATGTWVLVGKRDFESSKGDGKMDVCDLIEVYREQEKEDLKQFYPGNPWKLFASIGKTDDYSFNEEDDVVEFKNTTDIVFTEDNTMISSGTEENDNNNTNIIVDGVEIDFDEI